ncbi:DNase I-like protein, partial [Ramicandelaber brevisporus]
WNVNSVRTMTTACPTWKSYANILETLDADIYCFQETKLNRVGVTEEHALVPGYDAYFSFSKTKPGYSGVVTYIKQSSKLSVVDAEEGITGLLHLDSGAAKQPAAKKMRHISENVGASAIYTQKEANELDCEGRCVIVDIGAFIIINVYVPNGANEERTAYKVRFLRAVRERTAQLEKLGRRVLVIGDINVSPQQIDHFSPSDWEADHDNVPYDKEPGRVFLREWNLSKEQLDQGSAESGHVVDLFRYFYPDRKDAFTCWSPFQRHRERNMGYRIDLALATPNLVQMAADSDIMPKTFGSDHIPI